MGFQDGRMRLGSELVPPLSAGLWKTGLRAGAGGGRGGKSGSSCSGGVPGKALPQSDSCSKSYCSAVTVAVAVAIAVAIITAGGNRNFQRGFVVVAGFEADSIRLWFSRPSGNGIWASLERATDILGININFVFVFGLYAGGRILAFGHCTQDSQFQRDLVVVIVIIAILLQSRSRSHSRSQSRLQSRLQSRIQSRILPPYLRDTPRVSLFTKYLSIRPASSSVQGSEAKPSATR
mmetsp:Transcript_22112/g.61503  ORF Transcript_22112/g.61503 Transcript_22112/m.61503 type:complete len:235 (-) Transcript_22112:352-1056(-)